MLSEDFSLRSFFRKMCQTRFSLPALTFIAGNREDCGSGWMIERTRTQSALCTTDENIAMCDAVYYVTKFHLPFDAQL